MSIQTAEPANMNAEQLEKLLWDEIGDLLHVENMLLKALPKLVNGACSPDLKGFFQKHFRETQRQVKRIEEMFATVDLPPREKKCEAMMGLLMECQHLLTKSKPSLVTDQALVCAMQKIESFEIVSYRAITRWANFCGHDKIKGWAIETAAEEQAMLDTLERWTVAMEPASRRQK